MAKNGDEKSTGDSRRGRFVRLAESRTSNAIRGIRTIAKLGNKAQYEFDEADIRKIAAALTKEIEAMKIRMGERGSKENIEFKL
jgi:hypothetical protein